MRYVTGNEWNKIMFSLMDYYSSTWIKNIYIWARVGWDTKSSVIIAKRIILQPYSLMIAYHLRLKCYNVVFQLHFGVDYLLFF